MACSVAHTAATRAVVAVMVDGFRSTVDDARNLAELLLTAVMIACTGQRRPPIKSTLPVRGVTERAVARRDQCDRTLV
ncbi:MAG: hypothetical protein QOI74_1679 [Micromonosporaceae bacterium]|nr:hypothetical protein [Micromonosporaceae bacterium]